MSSPVDLTQALQNRGYVCQYCDRKIQINVLSLVGGDFEMEVSCECIKNVHIRVSRMTYESTGVQELGKLIYNAIDRHRGDSPFLDENLAREAIERAFGEKAMVGRERMMYKPPPPAPVPLEKMSASQFADHMRKKREGKTG